jgi:hypothetical protein
MSGTVCSLFPGLDARAPDLYDRLPLRYPEYALSCRMRVV